MRLVVLAALALVAIAAVTPPASAEHQYEIIVDGVWPEPTPYPEPTCNPQICPELVYPPDEPIYDVTIEPTEVPTMEPTVEPTVVPTEPTWEPTATPTEIPTEIPTEVPTTEPTQEPTVEPTLEPTPEPTATQEPVPTTAVPGNIATPVVTDTPLKLVPVVANFTCSPTDVHIGESITCVDTTLNASYAWQWSWGDGSGRDYGKTINHTFTKPGIYDIWHSAQSKSPFVSGALWKFDYVKVRPLPSMQVDVTQFDGYVLNTTQSIAVLQKPKYITIFGDNETVLGIVEFSPVADNYSVVLLYNETELDVEV